MIKVGLNISVALLLTLSACSVYQIHPGAVNKTDSVAYDSLLVTQAIIEQARAENAAGNLPEASKAPLNILIEHYNITRQTWLTYRGAVRSGQSSNVSALRSALELMNNSLNTYKRTRTIQ